jgi:hypothetical protein
MFSFNGKFMTLMLFTFLFFISVACLDGCGSIDDEAPKTFFKVYRENGDGSYTVWEMVSEPEENGGMVSWRDSDNLKKTISGKITIEEHLLSERSQLEKRETPDE